MPQHRSLPVDLRAQNAEAPDAAPVDHNGHLVILKTPWSAIPIDHLAIRSMAHGKVPIFRDGKVTLQPNVALTLGDCQFP